MLFRSQKIDNIVSVVKVRGHERIYCDIDCCICHNVGLVIDRLTSNGFITVDVPQLDFVEQLAYTLMIG